MYYDVGRFDFKKIIFVQSNITRELKSSLERKILNDTVIETIKCRIKIDQIL